MAIGFRNIEDTSAQVYLSDRFLGTVKMDLWRNKWMLYPKFNFRSEYQNYLYIEHLSFYEAGKAMVELYNTTRYKKKKVYDPLADTDEFDVSDIFKDWGP